jgi:hypothetical protein
MLLDATGLAVKNLSVKMISAPQLTKLTMSNLFKHVLLLSLLQLVELVANGDTEREQLPQSLLNLNHCSLKTSAIQLTSLLLLQLMFGIDALLKLLLLIAQILLDATGPTVKR